MAAEPDDPKFDETTIVIETAGETETFDTKFLIAALLLFVAKGDGNISDLETETMLATLQAHFELESSEALALLTRAMGALAENPDLESLLRRLSTLLNDRNKEDIAVMLLNVISADGRRDVEEMEKMDIAAAIIDISPEVMHRAHTRYFEQQAG